MLLHLDVGVSRCPWRLRRTARWIPRSCTAVNTGWRHHRLRASDQQTTTSVELHNCRFTAAPFQAHSAGIDVMNTNIACQLRTGTVDNGCCQLRIFCQIGSGVNFVVCEPPAMVADNAVSETIYSDFDLENELYTLSGSSLYSLRELSGIGIQQRRTIRH